MAKASRRILLPPHTPVQLQPRVCRTQTALPLPRPGQDPALTSTVRLGAGAHPWSRLWKLSLGSRRRSGSHFHRWAAGQETD